MINGLIILLILYPTKTQYYYYKLLGMWTLATGSQLSTLFIGGIQGNEAYYIISVIFYTGNVLFFYLALLAIEQVYWEVSEAVKSVKEEVSELNTRWPEGHIPKLFDGGWYGSFSKRSYHYFQFILLYLISLAFLGIYSFLVWFYLKSQLGFVGLVSTVIYDIFVQIFNSLQH
jgi:hypothetical protein